MAGGYQSPDVVYNVEIIDLESPNNVCQNQTDFPEISCLGAGGLFNGTTPIICSST